MPPDLPAPKGGQGGYVQGRCGKCTNCIHFKKKEIQGRIAIEVASGRTRWTYMTLTYEHRPTSRPEWMAHGPRFQRSLAQRHVRNGHLKPVYFQVAERGGLTGREHWHALVTSEYHWPDRWFEIIEDDPTWHHGGIKAERPRSFPALVNYIADYIDKPDTEARAWSRGFGLDPQHRHLADLVLRHHNAGAVEIPGMFTLGNQMYPFAPYARQKAKELARDLGLELLPSSHAPDLHELPVELTKEAIRHRNSTRRRNRAMAKLAPKRIEL